MRSLTAAERAALSDGLAAALERAGAEPLIVARAALGARIAALWRGSVPITAWGNRIYWPGASPDFADTPSTMALLQHELQHVLEFATGELRPLGYALNPRNWTYAYDPDPDAVWRDFGAEQRAQVVEDLWRGEHGLLGEDAHGDWRRRIVPWACDP